MDWNPELYAQFGDLRLRPALDLLGRVPALPQGDVIDLGCGAGAVAPALRARFPGRRLLGVDTSDAMIGTARATGAYDALAAADIAAWSPAQPPALIFSNAALHWLPDHGTLLPRLARALGPSGVFALQMPRQFFAPSHRFLRDIAADMYPDRFDFATWSAPVASPVDVHRLLAPHGAVAVWETDYVQRLEATEGGHPVARFTEATAMRPILDRLRPREASAFRARYEAALAAAYPPEADGAVLFPFRRLFALLQRPEA